MIVYTYLDRNTSNDCVNKDDFIQDTFKGVVIKKYFDQDNHNFMTIALNGAEPLILMRDTPFYSFIKAGDFIVKKNNTNTIVVKRGNLIYNFRLDFGCMEK